MLSWWRRRRRRHIRALPFPAAWAATISKNVPYVGGLADADRKELLGHVQVFLAEKRFEGCGGMTVTDEVRLTIAAQACVLLLHRETDYYPGVLSILVYPSTYVVPGERRLPGGLVSEGGEPRLGESWTHDVVVLAWDSVLSGARALHDGHNVVFHEFAHQLDQESGGSDGTPALPERSMYATWGRVLGRSFDTLVADIAQSHHHLLDAYGATNPAEFFAVATETFFERAKQMASEHPDLYAELRTFYRQDPAAARSSS